MIKYRAKNLLICKNFFTIALALISSSLSNAQELNIGSRSSSTSASTNQLGQAPTASTALKSNSDAFTKSSTTNLQQIGMTVAPYSQGNVNSPPVEYSDIKNVARIENKPTINLFQQFIRGTTGRELEIFGYNLFNSNAYVPNNLSPAPTNYSIGPGDEIDIKVWGSIELNIRQIVDRDGRITLPQIGTIGISGTKVEDLDKLLKKQIGRIYKGFEVSGTLSRLRNIQIYVVGNAKKPGAYSISGLSTLVSALFEVGGPSQLGTMRNIRLIREGKEVSKLDLYEFIKDGASPGNVKLLAGDVIQIPAVGSRVALMGAIEGQAIYEINKSTDIFELLRFVGEKNTLIAPKKVLIERIDNDSINGNRSVEEISLDSTGTNTKLKDGDIINLFKINQQFSNAITLKGNVASPLRYKFREGMKISDLIPEPAALIQGDYYEKKNLEVLYEKTTIDKNQSDLKTQLNEINWEYALIERMDKNEIKLNIITFNLAKAIKNKNSENDVSLMPGDVVTIFGNKEIPIPQGKRNIFVKISGEINSPGIYQITQGETLNDAIKKSGGFSKDAYLYGMSFTRESTRKLQQENLNKSITRIESDINSQTSTNLQNTLNTESAIAAQIQLNSSKLFLNRLKGLQASGRISLEMNSKNTELPMLILEDGDEIYVPSRPSSIGVFGAVYSETTLIHKPNSTVREYLSKSGLAREADDKSILLIRADGSVDSDGKASGLFTTSVLDMKLNPGDAIYVPEVIDRRNGYTQFIQGAKDWTSILYQFGIGAAAWKTLKN